MKPLKPQETLWLERGLAIGLHLRNLMTQLQDYLRYVVRRSVYRKP